MRLVEHTWARAFNIPKSQASYIDKCLVLIQDEHGLGMQVGCSKLFDFFQTFLVYYPLYNDDQNFWHLQKTFRVTSGREMPRRYCIFRKLCVTTNEKSQEDILTI